MNIAAMTLSDIIAIEPRVNNVLRRAGRDRRCNKDVVYTECKNELSRLVGWGAEDEALRTEEAYERVIIGLSEVLRI